MDMSLIQSVNVLQIHHYYLFTTFVTVYFLDNQGQCFYVVSLLVCHNKCQNLNKI